MGGPAREEARNLVFTMQLLRYSGMWPSDEDGWGYRMYWILMSLNYYALVVFILSVVFSDEGDARSLMKNACYILSLLPRCVTMLSMLLRRCEYRVLVASIQRSTSGIHDDLYDDDELPFRAASHFERTVSRCYLLLLTMGAMGYMLLPLAGSSGRSQLPLATYPLLDRADPASFAVEYMLQVGSVSAMMAVSVPLDLFEFFAIKYCAHQFQALAVLLRSAAGRHPHPRDDGSKVGSEQDIASAVDPRRCSQCDLPSPGGNSFEETLPSLIRYHQSILENAEKLTNLFSPLLLADYATVSIAICLLLYQIAMYLWPGRISSGITMLAYLILQREDDAELLPMVCHLFATFLRLYIICYWCSELMCQSLLVADVACSCPWYGYRVSTKKSLCTLVCRAQRPVLLTAGRYAVMSLHTFSTLIQGAYSYYNLLKHINHS